MMLKCTYHARCTAAHPLASDQFNPKIDNAKRKVSQLESKIKDIRNQGYPLQQNSQLGSIINEVHLRSRSLLTLLRSAAT